MEQRRLGRTDLQVSSIGMGCVTFGREIDRATSLRILDHARDRGITLFDTAEAYAQGGSENVLGEWLNQSGVRAQIVLATKVTPPLTRERVLESAEDSLRRLRTDRIDLFQLHVWDDQTPLEETLLALEQLVQQGKVRYIGCSNWQAWQLCKALLWSKDTGSAPLQSIQPPYNLVQREIETEVLPLCADQQIGVLAYSPLGAGFLTGKYQRGGEVPRGTRFDVIPGHQPIYFTDHGYAVLDRATRAAAACGVSLVQFALGWVLRRPLVTSVLIGARKTAQVDQAFTAESACRSGELGEALAEWDASEGGA